VLQRPRDERPERIGLGTAALLVAVSLLLVVLSGTPPVAAARSIGGDAIRAVSEPVAAVGEGLAGIAVGFSSATDLGDALTAALAERDRLAAEAARVASLEREIAELQAALDLRATTSFSTVAVQVVARDFSLERRVVIVDAGTGSGLAVGDVVIGAGNTLAGRVISAGPSSAEVRLVSDPGFSVTAEIAATGAIGLLRGRGSNPLLLQDVDARWEVPVGAQLTTSGIELSPEIRSAFPRGLAIGRVAAVNGTGSSIVQSADVEPILALDSARTLLVITNYRGGLPAPSVAP